jgi:hypothetical protein
VATRWWTGSKYPPNAVASEACVSDAPWNTNVASVTGRVGLTGANGTQFVSYNNVPCSIPFLHVLCLCAPAP